LVQFYWKLDILSAFEYMGSNDVRWFFVNLLHTNAIV
jgi:hypothetical protein